MRDTKVRVMKECEVLYERYGSYTLGISDTASVLGISERSLRKKIKDNTAPSWQKRNKVEKYMFHIYEIVTYLHENINE